MPHPVQKILKKSDLNKWRPMKWFLLASLWHFKQKVTPIQGKEERRPRKVPPIKEEPFRGGSQLTAVAGPRALSVKGNLSEDRVGLFQEKPQRGDCIHTGLKGNPRAQSSLMGSPSRLSRHARGHRWQREGTAGKRDLYALLSSNERNDKIKERHSGVH